MRENSSRFRLAYSSLILENNICKELGPSGEGKLSQEILNSQEQLHNHPKVQEIFKLFHHSQHKIISTHIMTDQWIEYWKQANKRTASSYSGLHFRHYKVYTLMLEIAEIKYKLVNLAIRSGQPLSR